MNTYFANQQLFSISMPIHQSNAYLVREAIFHRTPNLNTEPAYLPVLCVIVHDIPLFLLPQRRHMDGCGA
jgi:hypothetical protein